MEKRYQPPKGAKKHGLGEVSRVTEDAWKKGRAGSTEKCLDKHLGSLRKTQRRLKWKDRDAEIRPK